MSDQNMQSHSQAWAFAPTGQIPAPGNYGVGRHGAPGLPGPGRMGPYGQPQYRVAPPRNSDGWGIASLILSIVWLGGLGSLLAVVFGHIGISRTRRERGSASGLAVAGLVLGYLGIALVLLVLVFAVPAFQAARQQGSIAVLKSDLRTVGVSEETYYTDNGAYTADIANLQPAPTLSSADSVEVIDANSSSLCLTGTSSKTSQQWYYTSSGGLSTTPCS
jgi:hypothetical protein